MTIWARASTEMGTLPARAGLLLALGALALTRAAGADWTPSEQARLISSHNTVRADVQPSAVPPLPASSWSSTLATSAQVWANACLFQHSGAPGVGENLYASTGDTNPRPTPEAVLASWASEQAFYDYATNTCAPGRVCGHYTQVVLRAATQVGCGITVCSPATSPFQPPFNAFNWHLVVCQYNAAQSTARPYLCDYDGNGTTTEVCSDLIFADGFESGDRSAWSASVPP